MNNVDLLLLLRKYRILYFTILITSAIIGALLLEPIVLKYEGESTFYLANENMVNPALFAQKGQQDLLQVNLVQERVYQLAYSTDMMLFLIKRFNLYDHYSIDTNQTYFFERAVRKLTKNIRFTKHTTDLSSIVVIDRNNEMASSMANAAVWKLDQLNKKYLSDKIQANLNFYDSFLKESRRITTEQNIILHDYISSLSDERKRSTGSTNIPLSEVEFTIYEAASKIGDITTQLVMARNFYSQVLNTQKVQNLPSLVIIKRALPELSSRKPYLAIFAALAGIVATVFTILIMYFFISYQKELHILFGKKTAVNKGE